MNTRRLFSVIAIGFYAALWLLVGLGWMLHPGRWPPPLWLQAVYGGCLLGFLVFATVALVLYAQTWRRKR
jgi:hypothetical protein